MLTDGRIAERIRQGDWELVWFSCSPELTALIVSKGSVAVDGISLTIVEVAADRFSVALIPHTLSHTTLGHKGPGASVNIENGSLGEICSQIPRSTDFRSFQNLGSLIKQNTPSAK